MRRVKVCMLGASAVGKTSLVARYVRGVFSDRYRTTIGVAIERRLVHVGDDALDLVVWDLEGDDEFAPLRTHYLRGVAGCMFVADGTRADTLAVALRLADEVSAVVGPGPRLLVLNKADLGAAWEVGDRRLAALEDAGWSVARASARTGEGVEAAFNLLSRAILEEGVSPHGHPPSP